LLSSWVGTRSIALFAYLISHQPTVLFSQNKSTINNQPAILFSQNKPAPATSQTNRPTHHICMQFHEVYEISQSPLHNLDQEAQNITQWQN
jgi:hypothetical protein